ncbi:MAG: TetR/AcrR family transcriptional regulator [Burkholderiales bacterium]
MSTARPNGETTEKAIRRAAIEVIARHGFEAASLRMIAKEVGLQAPSMYNYIKSKEQLLFDLLKGPVSAMTAEYEERAKALPDPFDRLSLFIEVHLDFHLAYTQEVFIGNMELRNLSKPHYKIITGLRDRYSMLLTRIIEDGVAEGKFQVDEPRVTTFALLAMLSGVCNWYRPDGPVGKASMIQIHTQLALQMLGLGAGNSSLPRRAARGAAGPRTA